MKPLKSNEIYGNWATLLLPIKSDDAIDFLKLEQEIDFLIEAKVDGIYSNGTAGEFYNITEKEFDKISVLLAKKCNCSKMPFQIGVSHMSPKISLGRLKRIVQLRPSAIQLILPDWFKVTKREALVYLKKMEKEAGSIGLVLYNPPHSKWVLSSKEIAELKEEIPHLVGVKVAGGDDNWYEEMRNNCSGLSVFIPGHFLASGCQKGAHGAYSNMACLNPVASQKWYELIKSDNESALELESRINQFLTQYIVPFIIEEKYANQAVDKFMAAVGNWIQIEPRLRWPYSSINSSEIDRVRKGGKKIIPEFFV